MDNETLEVLSKETYMTPQRYISGRVIEYDIKSCNITILRKYGVIDDDSFTFFSNLPKIERERSIGIMEIEHPEFVDIISNGTKEARIRFGELNNIKLPEIVRIAKDAIYINRFTDLPYTQIDKYILFRQKSISSVVLQITDTVTIYYYRDINTMNVDVKGISDQNMALHQNYMLSFIATVINMIENAPLEDAVNFIREFYINYVNKKLDIGFYREFNSYSLYSVSNSGYYVSNIDNMDLIDIKYNMNIIRYLWQIVLSKMNK